MGRYSGIEHKLMYSNAVEKHFLKCVIGRMKKTHCDLDSVPISDIVESVNFSYLVDIILMIVNTSIMTCTFPVSEKSAIVKPVLKGTHDYQELSSYRPVSNLSFLSKILEYVILDQ